PSRRLVRSIFYLSSSRDLRDLHSFPTRRSSDLLPRAHRSERQEAGRDHLPPDRHEIAGRDGEAHADERPHARVLRHLLRQREGADRKSTRLNSSHVKISYAVFCLKKKIMS